MSNKRILALATNPEIGASTRYRVLQWAPDLAQAGFLLTLDAFFSTAAAAVVYRPGTPVRKLAYFMSGAIRRSVNLLRAARGADFLFVHREAFPFGRRLLLDRIVRFPGPVLYDYDDAMFLSQPGRSGRRLLLRLEDLETPGKIMRASAAVLAGNEYLATYARKHAGRVVVLPTCVDTRRFRPVPRSGASDQCVVAWIGSHSTVPYLRSVFPALRRTAARHRFVLKVVGAGQRLHVPDVTLQQAPWTLSHEVEDFQDSDIGIYPLWDDAWTRGKCGFKAIQFMACGTPVVAAAIPANEAIIEDGVNGFLAGSDEEWVEKLGRLIADPALRKRLGEAGRRTVEACFSVSANAPRLVQLFQDLAGGRDGRA